MTLAHIEKDRAAILAKLAEREAIVDAPESRETIRAKLAAWVRTVEDAGARRLAWRIGQGSFRDLLTTNPPPPANPVSGTGGADIGPLIVAMFGGDSIIASLNRFVDRLPEGLTDEQRAERLAEIDAQLHALEVSEERAVRALIAAGTPVVRRMDADCAIVLGDL
jgi:hypothetical protein